VTNSLANLFHEIATEWHPTKNGDLTPDQIVAGSRKKVWWKCPKGPDHEWSARLDHRTGIQSDCPFCDITPRSKQELYLAFELLNFIDFDIDEHKIKVEKKIYDVDIIIRKHNIVIEYDGSYWHKDSVDVDLAKTNKLMIKGWNVIRVRERPLKKITTNDIIFSTNDIKQAANKLLLKIESTYDLEFPHFLRYLKRKTLINKKAADSYIDKLFKEKY